MPFVQAGRTVAPMKIDLKFISLGVLLVLVGFGAGYLLQVSDDGSREPDHVLDYDANCDLNQSACQTLVLAQGEVEFSIGPRPIYGASPLTFEVKAKQLAVRSAVINLSGLDMNMGSYRFELESDGSGGFSVDGNLPVCVRNQMQWKAELRLNTREHGLVLLPYIFTAYKYGSRQ